MAWVIKAFQGLAGLCRSRKDTNLPFAFQTPVINIAKDRVPDPAIRNEARA